jgi:peptidoglycan/xylan/chitin deacetylase (PgdA/CDA1 family)
MALRSVAKRMAEGLLIHSGIAAAARTRTQGRALILAYHNIVPDDAPPAGDLPNHLTRTAFEAQLDVLLETHDVVPLQQLIDGDQSVRRARVAITFDDAYRGAVLLGMPALAARGLAATIFVAPGLLGGQTFWWDECAALTNGLAPQFRTEALERLAGDGDAIRSWARTIGAAGQAPSCPFRRSATTEELASAAALPGISLGSHSWSHPALTRVSPERLVEELRASRRWLLEQRGVTVDAIAYPYGAVDARVMTEARRAGYRAGFRVDGGWMRSAVASTFDEPRLNVVPGLSDPGFRIRLAGVRAH